MKFHRKIKCPRHFLLKPGFPPYVMRPNPLTKNLSEKAIRDFNLRTEVPDIDSWGRKKRDPRSWHQPEVSAAWCIEHVYDPKSPECINLCRRRCMEGKDAVLIKSIKRLNA